MSIEGAGDLMNAVLKEQRCSDCGKTLVVLGWAKDEYGPHVQSVCGSCHPELVPGAPRIITRVMDDGIKTKDGAA